MSADEPVTPHGHDHQHQHLRLEAVGDEVLLIAEPGDGADHIVVSLPNPAGVDELIALLTELRAPS